jgi:hypothetical protein
LIIKNKRAGLLKTLAGFGRSALFYVRKQVVMKFLIKKQAEFFIPPVLGAVF